LFDQVLLFFVISNAMNAIFMIIQMGLVAATATECSTASTEELAKSPFGFICGLGNQAGYFAPIILLIIFAITCAVLACLLRAALDDDGGDGDGDDSKAKEKRNNYY
jgi:hypothetical protein